MTHKLKTIPCYFERVWDDEKNFEIRYDEDRGFQKGDKVILREYERSKPTIDSHRYTGRQVIATIGFVTGYEQKENHVVFSLVDKRNSHE